MPFALAFLPLIKDSYSFWDTNCWIFDSTHYEFSLVCQLVLLYVPLWLILVYIVSVYLRLKKYFKRENIVF